jgi:superoxide dismutase, Fe-Mn family
MTDLDRRTFLYGSAAAVASSQSLGQAFAQGAGAPSDLIARLTYPFSVPALPYTYEANEPSIDAQTMRIHHDKHHLAYVSNLNAALKDHPELQSATLQELLVTIQTVPEKIRTVVRNNAGGHANHTMFWQVMGGKGGEPSGALAAAIQRDFRSFEKLKEDLNRVAAGVFGSGWALVLTDRAGKLSLVAKANQDSPLTEGLHTVFGNDVWEHAYYLKYQNRRADYLAAWWSVLDWPRIAERYAAAKAGTLNV